MTEWGPPDPLHSFVRETQAQEQWRFATDIRFHGSVHRFVRAVAALVWTSFSLSRDGRGSSWGGRTDALDHCAHVEGGTRGERRWDCRTVN